MRACVFYTLLVLTIPLSVAAQITETTDTCNTRQRIAGAAGIGIGGGSLAYLATIWYAPYRSDGFHFFDDNAEWLQMDKAGHAFSGYALARYTWEGARWACLSPEAALRTALLGPGIYLAAIEVMDGFSPGYGASWGDLTADMLGIALFAAQQSQWKEQRIRMKWSFHRSRYAVLRPELLGSGAGEEAIKDYNGQTYWLTFNLQSLGIIPSAPEWLNLALGYGAEGMTGGHDNPITSFPGSAGDPISRHRQFYIAPDINLGSIPVNKPWLRKVLGLIDIIHLPLPALEIGGERLRFHTLYF